MFFSGVAAEPKPRHSAQRPLRPNFVIPEVAAAPKPRHSAQYPLRPNFVILRAVAESISACQRTP